jgi:hypothetical protein
MGAFNQHLPEQVQPSLVARGPGKGHTLAANTHSLQVVLKKAIKVNVCRSVLGDDAAKAAHEWEFVCP